MKACKNCLLILLTVALFGMVMWVNGCKTEDTTDTKPIPTKNDILIYPREPELPLGSGAIGILNPRFPVVPPHEGGSRGRCMQVQFGGFHYSLSPYVRFPEGGRLSMATRDNLHPPGQGFFYLYDSTHTLKLIRNDLGNDLQVRFVYARGKEELASVDLTPFPAGWSDVELKWDRTTARLYREGKTVAEVKLTTPFDPIKVDCGGWPVDELRLVGDGQFSLDWESGYAAHITLCSKPDARLILRVFGFDSHVISLDPTKRDCPMIQIINTGPGDEAATVSFDVRSEVTKQHHAWQQKVTVPSRSERMVPIRFPFDLQSDIYHMTIKSAETTPPLDTSRHFMYIKLRGEPAGPEKFGLHDSGRPTGSWPDALPIHLDHNYTTWGATQGPCYVKWWNGSWGMDPDLPPEHWWWRSAVNRGFYAGRTVLACVSGQPSMPWMRGKEYEESIPRWKLGPDYVGGAPNFKRYRRYLRALAARYKGRISFYEIHNEPNAMGWNYVKPEDYVETCKAVYEEMKAVDPDVRIFGISGTADFLGYMREVFKLGGHEYMDGVSWHTYMQPVLPHEVDLMGKLAAARKAMAETGKKLALINTETGLKFANREYIDRPMTDAELRALKRTGGDTYPERGMTEHRGGAAYVENIIVNFLAGAEYFTIFGWNPVWSDPNVTPGSVWYGWFVGAAKEGRRTPGLHTLAVGVLTAQMEPAVHARGRTVNEHGVQGGIFPKTNGGELAVLWSTGGSRTVSLKARSAELEMVSMLGLTSVLTAREGGPFYTYTIDLGEEPRYVHAATSIALTPPPLRDVDVNASATGTLGDELITNGGFDSDTAGWIPGDVALSSEGGGQSRNHLRIVRSAAAACYAYQVFPTVIGSTYKLSAYVKGSDCGGRVRIGTSAGGGQIMDEPHAHASWTEMSRVFTAASTTTYVSLVVNSVTLGSGTDFDTVSVKEILPYSASKGRLTLTLENVFSGLWQDTVSFKKDARWRIEPAQREFTLAPGKQAKLLFDFEVAPGVPQGRYSQAIEIAIPDGGRYVSAVEIPVKAVFGIPRLPEGISMAKMRDWQPPGGGLLLKKRDQVVLGKPSDLASLQEQGTWAGPAELSAEAKIGYDEEGLSVYVKVHDAHPDLPEAWPGVAGTCLEFFFDFRSENEGLGNPNYGRDAHQIVVRPVIKQGQKPGVWHPSASSSPLPNLSVEAGCLDAENYWVALRIPWSDIGRSFNPGMRMGFDIGVNGPPRNRKGRKTQIMMFGGSSNCVDASLFGVGILGDRPGKGDL